MKNKILINLCLSILLILFNSCEKDDSFNGENGSFKDNRDGKIYEWVKIGNQIWMAENLAYKLDSNCLAYNNNENYVSFYGYLYDWDNAIKSVPNGWHLPSDLECLELIEYLAYNSYSYDQIIGNYEVAKSLCSISGWLNSDNIGSVGNKDYPEMKNLTGFNGWPSGFYNYRTGEYENSGSVLYFWTNIDHDSYESICFTIQNDYSYIEFSNNPFMDKRHKISIRCIKDN